MDAQEVDTLRERLATSQAAVVETMGPVLAALAELADPGTDDPAASMHAVLRALHKADTLKRDLNHARTDLARIMVNQRKALRR
jgi:hypothetical protein